MTDERRSTLSIILLGLIVIVLIDQARFLFVYPVPDTGMWFGDETWTMLTLRELARSGIARVPEAIGSSLAHSNGLINGSVWISGLIYGVPALVFRTIASPVSIGRVISLLLALLSLWLVYYLARKLRASREVALIVIFLFVISGAFSFSSHSARLDMATSFAILLYFILLLAALDRASESQNVLRFSFLIPLLVVLSLAVYVHIPALVAIPAIYTLWRMRAFHQSRTWFAMIAGAVVGIVIIVGAYWISTGSLSLLGTGYNQYYNVANSLPVLHLRSWRVQKINTIDRALQVWGVAWPLVLAVVVGVVIRWRMRTPLSTREKFFMVNAVLLILSWGLFGGPAVFYNIYILPVVAVCAVVLCAPALMRGTLRAPKSALLIALLFFLTAYAVIRQEQVGAVGERLVRNNRAAIQSLVGPIASQSNPPLVLTDEPAINEIAATPGVQLMTNHLLLFGGESLPLPDILREHHVNYLLLYSTVRWRSPFRQIADSLYTLVTERTGTLTDQARTYDDPDWNEIDTLRLYKAQ